MVEGRRFGRRTALGLGLGAGVAAGTAGGLVGWRAWRRRRRAAMPWIRSLRTDDTMRSAGGVVVIGDSLTFERIDDLVAQLRDAGYGPVRVDARPGRRCYVDVAMSGSGVRAVADARAAGARPSVWLVSLGQNDAEATEDAAVVLDAIGAEPTVWVNLAVTIGSVAPFNDALVAFAAARRPHVRIADWAAVASSHPEWFVADGIHNTPTGAAARNRFLVESLRGLASRA